MKVIGKDEHGNYIAVVSHTELRKLCDKYYGREELKELKIGQELDLAAGYNFREDIKRACSSMVEASEQFDRSQKTLFEFAQMVNKLPMHVEASAEKVTA